MARILIVEDEPDIAASFQQRLEREGHRVDVAGDGLTAQKRVGRARREYDVILTDLRMKRMSGRSFLEMVHPLLEDKTPVIVMSGWPHLLDALGATRKWAFQILQKPVDLDDMLEAVERALHQRKLLKRLRKLEARVAELERRQEVFLTQNESLFEEARIDGLTRLPNRRRLEEDLDVLDANVGRYRTPFAIAFCDVDDFGRFNNEQDYGVGDDVVKLVADRLRRSCRRGDIVYRYGGDEFVIVLAHQDAETARHALDRFREDLAAMECSVLEHGLPAKVTMSVGVIAVAGDPERKVKDLIDEASRLCKEAKTEGGNRVRAATGVAAA